EVGPARADRRGHRRKRPVFLGGGRERQYPRRAFGPRADLVHQGGDVGAFDGLERRGHGEIHVLSISPYHVRGAPARPHLLPRPLGKCNDGRSGTRGRQMKLKDQVAVVTGAGRNIGEEGAKLFAAEGAKSAIVGGDKPRGGGAGGGDKR